MAEVAMEHKDGCTTVSTDEARRRLAELISLAAYRGERSVITHHGKPRAAIVSIADLERLLQSAA